MCVLFIFVTNIKWEVGGQWWSFGWCGDVVQDAESGDNVITDLRLGFLQLSSVIRI